MYLLMSLGWIQFEPKTYIIVWIEFKSFNLIPNPESSKLKSLDKLWVKFGFIKTWLKKPNWHHYFSTFFAKQIYLLFTKMFLSCHEGFSIFLPNPTQKTQSTPYFSTLIAKQICLSFTKMFLSFHTGFFCFPAFKG